MSKRFADYKDKTHKTVAENLQHRETAAREIVKLTDKNSLWKTATYLFGFSDRRTGIPKWRSSGMT